MLRVDVTFFGVFVGAYAMSKCPWIDGATTPYAVGIMGILVVIMLAQRLKFCSLGFVPRVDYPKAAIFIAGADQPAGWMMAVLNETHGMKVYAGVEDLNAPSTEWIRRHLSRFTTVVKMDPSSAENAVAAARLVEETKGDSVLVGVVYAGYTVPKISDTIDVDEVRKQVNVNALAAVTLAKAFAPLLRNGKGRFVLMADMAGRVAIPSLLSYCASQAVVLQCAKYIRIMLEKYRVTTHVVEPMLFNFRKTQELYHYPGSNPDTGKVILENSANHTDNRAYLIVRNVVNACMEKTPKERYLTTFEESFIDLIIRFTPACIHNRIMTFYLNYFLVKKPTGTTQ